MVASGEAWRKAEEEAICLTNERASLLLELRTSKDELPASQAYASKENKAFEEAFNAGFNVIFKYSYGCYAFAHNISGSKPGIPDGMPDTSKPLPPKFFINPQCPSSVVHVEAVVTPKAGTSEAVEHSFATELK